MKLNTTQDVKAFTVYQKIERIRQIETKLNSLSKVPVYSGIILVAYCFIAYFSGQTVLSPINLILFAIAIWHVGHANVQRTDLLQELFKLKYDQ